MMSSKTMTQLEKAHEKGDDMVFKKKAKNKKYSSSFVLGWRKAKKKKNPTQTKLHPNKKKIVMKLGAFSYQFHLKAQKQLNTTTRRQRIIRRRPGRFWGVRFWVVRFWVGEGG